MAFECPHCHTRNNEIQPASTIEEQGCCYSCRIDTKEDLNRQIVKSEYASIRFVEIDLDIPPQTQKGLLNTVEGFLSKTKEDLEADQEWRKTNASEVWQGIEELLARIQKILDCQDAVTVVLDDPSGNSYIENLRSPAKDPKMTIKHYKRTADQIEMLGLQPESEPLGGN
jgi:zinc finger protein